MVTLQQIAKAAGVSIYTVSCALRGHAQVAGATRERIARIAAELGYSANVSGKILAGRNSRSRSAQRRAAIGMFRTKYDELRVKAFQETCSALGYGSQLLQRNEFGAPEQVANVLWNRGVAGLVVAQDWDIFRPEEWLRFDWSRLAAVKITRLNPTLSLHLVTHSAIDFAQRALRETFLAGANRLAVLLVDSGAPDDDDARLGAVLSWKTTMLQPGQSIEWRRYASCTDTAKQQLCEWLRAYRPDSVLAFPWTWIFTLRELGFAVPADFRMFSFIAPDETIPLRIPGNRDNRDEMVRTAVQTIHQLLLLGERGLAATPQEHVLGAPWLSESRY